MRNKKLVVADVPVPQPGPGEVLAKTLACGICGSDLHARHGIDQWAEMAVRAGYDRFGSSADAVTRAYGSPTYRFQGNLQYVLDFPERIDRYQLTFVIMDSRVKTIWAFIPVQ